VDFSLGVPATVASAGLVLVAGRLLIERVDFLKRYSIPEPVVGGISSWKTSLAPARRRRWASTR
jgi:ESS family glutamate:Na+ symporter